MDTASPPRAFAAMVMGRVAERPGLARMSVQLSTVSTKTNAPRDRYPSGRGAQVWFNLSPPSGLILLATDPALELQATPIPEDPERTFGRAGTLADPRWTGLRPLSSFKSAGPALATPTDPARSPLTAVAGRRPDALPVAVR